MKTNWCWTAAILMVAVALRFPGMFTDFWGDEIWSWLTAGQLNRVADILLLPLAQIDNNHPLNTLWLYLLGPYQAASVYRLPALLAGVGTVAVAMHCMFRRGTICGIAAGVLTAIQFPLVFYSSEARGYSLAAFCSVVAFDALDVALARNTMRSELIFALAASVGFLSHLTFLFVYCGALAWSAVQLRGRWRSFVELHFVPLITAGVLFIVFVRHMIAGGGPPRLSRDVIIQTLSLTIGGPGGSTLVAIAALLLFLVALPLHFDESRSWIFYLTVVVIAPLVMMVHHVLFGNVSQPLSLRFFVVCMPFYLMALCPAIARALRKNIWWRLAIGAAAILFAIGNGVHYLHFLRDGRGHSLEALNHIAGSSPDATIRIATESQWRTQLLLSFDAPRMSLSRQIILSATDGDWVILDRQDPEPAAPAIDFHSKRYALNSIFNGGELSGWCWYIYRKI